MKKPLAISVILIIITLIFSACGGSTHPTTPSESADSPAISSERAETSSSRITHTEEDMPVNTPENEAYLQQYVIPFAGRGIFEKNYGPDNHEALSDSLLVMFDALRQVEGEPTNEELNSYDGVIPQDVVEIVLTAHFNLTPQEIREMCADEYDAEQKAYIYLWGLGGGPISFYVTDSKWDADILTLSYDLYRADNENPNPDVFQYALSSQGKTQIQVDGNNYIFISNETVTFLQS